MTDNSSLPVASGNETFANDDIGGVKYPRPKINWGPDGTANDVDVASGKPLPVQLRSPTGTDLTGTAGTGSAAVITVQGNASGTPVPVTLGAETTKAIGVVRNSDGAGNLLTSVARGSERALSTQIVDASGNQVTSFGNGTQYTEDVAAATDPIGNMVMAVRRDTLTVSEVSADGDNIAIKATNKGQMHVFAALDPASQTALGQASSGNSLPVALSTGQTFAGQNQASPTNQIVVGGQYNSSPTTITTGNVSPLQLDNGGYLKATTITAGTVAHDAADASPPVKTGAKATSSVSGQTPVSNGDVTDKVAGIDGVQITRPHCNLEDIVTAVVTCTSGANTQAIAAQSTGIKVYVTSVIIRNAGASNGNLILTDGSGGTTKADIPFPASTGTVWNPPVPLGFSAATAIFADPSGSDNIIVTVIGFKSKV